MERLYQKLIFAFVSLALCLISGRAKTNSHQQTTDKSKCPVLKIITPGPETRATDPWPFSVKIDGADVPDRLSYYWETTGKLKSGQGTDRITIEPLNLKARGRRGLIVMVYVRGLPEGCPESASVLIVSGTRDSGP